MAGRSCTRQVRLRDLCRAVDCGKKPVAYFPGRRAGSKANLLIPCRLAFSGSAITGTGALIATAQAGRRDRRKPFCKTRATAHPGIMLQMQSCRITLSIATCHTRKLAECKCCPRQMRILSDIPISIQVRSFSYPIYVPNC